MRKRVNVTAIGINFLCILVFLFLILPLFIIIPISFSASPFLEFPPRGFSLQWYEAYFHSSAWVGATFLSIRVAFITMIVSTIIGTMASLGLAKGNFIGKGVINAMIISPMLIPTIIVAISLYFLFARLRLIGTSFGLVLAHSALALPFVIVNVTATLRGLDERLEQSAMNLGANRLQAFLHITLPLISPGIATGALFAFITSFDEIVIAIFICGSRATTLPKQMWDGIRMEINPTIASVSFILITTSVILLVIVEMMRRIYEKRRT